MKKHLVSAIIFAFCSLGLQADMAKSGCCTSSCSTSSCSTSSCSTSSCSTSNCNNTCSDSCRCIATGQSFFTIRPAFERVSPEFLTLFRDREDRAEEGWGGAFQIVPLGGRSTKPNRLAQYFFPDCKTTLTIREQCPNSEPTDILAQHLGIHTENEDFESTITICPRHTFGGAGLSWKHSFYERCEGQNFWFLLSGPILHVRNKVNLCENVLQDGGGVNSNISVAVANATEAFKQDRWNFGKINDDCDNSKTGFGDLFVLLGYEFSEWEHCQLESYVGVIAPTSKSPNSVFLFEPIVGHNGNGAFTFGSSIWMDIWCDDCDGALAFAFDLSGQVFWNKKQCRSFDLKCKPWSRYMLVFANEDAANAAVEGTGFPGNTYYTNATPGINTFTREAKIRQGFTRAVNVALIYNRCCWEFEAGYNFWAQNAECVKLCCPLPSTVALASPCPAGTNGIANNVQQIGDIFDNDNSGSYSDNLIRPEDLDLRSAAHPCAQQQTFYGFLGYNWDDYCYPTAVGFGGSYQFDQYNTALNQWMIWGKLVVSF